MCLAIAYNCTIASDERGSSDAMLTDSIVRWFCVSNSKISKIYLDGVIGLDRATPIPFGTHPTPVL